jgi:hypothetical protein
MSDLLRDDVQETAIVSESWVFLASQLSEERGRGRDGLTFGVLVETADFGHGTEAAFGLGVVAVHDAVRVHDDVLHQSVSGVVLNNKGRLCERYVSPLMAVVQDAARGIGTVFDGSTKRLDYLHDTVRLRETWTVARVFADGLRDVVHGRDDVFLGGMNAGFMHDVAHGRGDVVLDVHHVLFIQDAGRGRDAVFTQAEHGAFWHDRVAVLASLMSDDEQDVAMIWTANMDTWAVSRYLPHDVNALAMVDDVVLGLSNKAVYALDGDDEVISGSLKMGLVDCSGVGLQHPVASYLEYSQDNDAVMDLAVTMLQSGRDEHFNYRLARERANSLTNGRFILGRGLRGRHFGFELKLSGKAAFVNDWTIDCVPTKRRI